MELKFNLTQLQIQDSCNSIELFTPGKNLPRGHPREPTLLSMEFKSFLALQKQIPNWVFEQL